MYYEQVKSCIAFTGSHSHCSLVHSDQCPLIHTGHLNTTLLIGNRPCKGYLHRWLSDAVTLGRNKYNVIILKRREAFTLFQHLSLYYNLSDSWWIFLDICMPLLEILTIEKCGKIKRIACNKGLRSDSNQR